ncbi:MAG: hypothetical protein JXR37_17350 [Kiritimatiellae bacterium]|nr:hypothetical protein [Kiritimatiellia bacterium]
MDTHESAILGIDVGSISVAAVILDSNGSIVYRQYLFHNGNILPALDQVLRNLPARQVDAFGVVAEKGREFFTAGLEVNEQVAIIEGVKRDCPEVGAILTIGGENFGLLLFDERGRYQKYISNSACAAGTGSFLDQQAVRLGLSGSEALSRIAAGYEGEPPKIATRCAVFAQTDLIHIQQQGYGLPAIAAGLAQGVARNICDALTHGVTLRQPIVAVGGVALNGRVIRYLEQEVKAAIHVPPDCEVMGAVGAALVALGRHRAGEARSLRTDELLSTRQAARSYFYPPLSETDRAVADQSSWRSFVAHEVEVAVYHALQGGAVYPCYLGIDVGSTSTKAVLMDAREHVLVGMYTRTKGQPIAAVQQLTRTLAELESRYEVRFRIIGAGTTGSGRKFIQLVARADYVVDEITAHARAAWHLEPKIDTIIEIGGQDAKFTVMKDGQVVFSVMNYVCAAGTGSFIEEQARRLGVALDQYAGLAMAHAAPLISDRCTVFMERDLNHLLSKGYTREELLASALHSVRDNYLTKVAHVNKIGEYIAFQGATAKNRALVKAFEQKLGKPIYVSRYCHLTGALGVCLKMAEHRTDAGSGFRRALHLETVGVEEYVCEYCSNHCKIKQIEIEGEKLGWGYLCGRDEASKGFRKRTQTGFNLLHAHRRVFDVDSAARQAHAARDVNLFHEFQQGGIRAIIRRPGLSLARLRNRIQFNVMELRNEIFRTGIVPVDDEDRAKAQVRVGLPRTLTLLEYVPLWRLFFEQLGFETVTPEMGAETVRSGREIRAAEYCAPVTEFHGCIRELAGQADWIFFPQLMETTAEEKKKFYCYYCHFAVPVVQNIPACRVAGRFIAPVLNMNEPLNDLIRKLYLSFPDALKKQAAFKRVDESFRLAHDWFSERRRDLQTFYTDQMGEANDICVALLGRPYVIFNPALNKDVPGKLAEKGIQSFFMDMIPDDDTHLDIAAEFAEVNHWHYGNEIIRKAEIVATTAGLFPILITAFKCSPDSFIVSYFKKIMDYYQKPYLIMQLDDHAASEGYDTRLEAAIETFRSHRPSRPATARPGIRFKRAFEDKVYLLPEYDHLKARLIQAAFRHAGIEAKRVEQSPEIITRSLRYNDGQCLPVSCISLGIQNAIEKHGLDPGNVVFFSNSDADVACNLPQYPVMIKQVLERLGNGMEKVDVLVARFLPVDLPIGLMYEIYMAYVLTGLVQKMTHRIRPREKRRGETNRVFRKATDRLADCFARGLAKEPLFQEIVSDYARIARHDRALAQVGIVGDLFVRDNDTYNQNLIAEIEKAGAEVVTVPFIDAMSLYAGKVFKAQWAHGEYLGLLANKMAFNALSLFGNRLRTLAVPVLGERDCSLKQAHEAYLKHYFLDLEHHGETVENLLKVFYLKEQYPDLKFIINVNPIFCCPGLISEAIYKKVEVDIDIPIISIMYDGTRADRNNVLKPYLHYLMEGAKPAAHVRPFDAITGCATRLRQNNT